MPRTTVRMKPDGLFGPGDKKRAISPATNPTTMIQIRPPMRGSFVNPARTVRLGRSSESERFVAEQGRRGASAVPTRWPEPLARLDAPTVTHEGNERCA